MDSSLVFNLQRSVQMSIQTDDVSGAKVIATIYKMSSPGHHESASLGIPLNVVVILG